MRAAPDATAAANERLYDPDRERVVARRLQGGRRRRLMLVMSAVVIAAAAAAGFTYTYQDMPTVTDAWAATMAAVPPPAPAAATPALASSASAPVRLVQPDSDPNKRQERITPEAPAGSVAAAPTGSSSMIPQGTGPSANSTTGAVPEGVRRIPLGPGAMAEAAPPSAPAFASAEAASPTEMTMPLAPLPQPRPRRAP